MNESDSASAATRSRVLVVAGVDSGASTVETLREHAGVAVDTVSDVETAIADLDRETYHCVVATTSENAPPCGAVRSSLAGRGFEVPFVPVPGDSAAETDGAGDGQSPAIDHVVATAARYRRLRTAETWNQFREFLWNLASDVVEAPTRQEIDTQVCERLQSRSHFEVAWICTRPPDCSLRTVRGREASDLEALRSELDRRDSDLPWQRAASERAVVVASVPDAGTDWTDPRGMLSVPLVHRRINYGVLNVASGRHDPAELEPAVETLTGFGQAVGHALATGEIQQQSELFQEAIEQADPAVAILDHEGIVEYVNRAFESVFGYAKSGVIESPFTEFLPTDAASLVTDIEVGDPWREEVVCHHQSGRRIHVDLSIAAVPVVGTADRKYIAVASDVTSLKEHQQRLQVLNRVLRHNLRNDLNVVIVALSQAIEHVDEEDLISLLDSAVERTDSLLATSEKARYAEQNIGRSSLGEIDTTDVIEILQHLITRFERQYPGADIAMQSPDTCLVLGPDFAPILEELLSNAIEHNDSDTPRVRVRVLPEDGPDGFVTVTIADDGPGIPPHERKVLEAERETELDHGNSLGLWAVKWMVTYAGGRLHIEDSDMGGSTVKLHLQKGSE